MVEPMLDNAFDALADAHRRQLLVDLMDHNPQFVPQMTGVSKELADADEVLLANNLRRSREITDADTELLRLHHVHVPKLVEYGFVEWDEDNHDVIKGPRFDDIRPLLELLDDRRDELPGEWP